MTMTKPKRKTGRFKSKFFEIKERKGKYRLVIKPSFKLNQNFQQEICHAFKRGLYKMYFEELNRQKGEGYDEKYNSIRMFARYDKISLPVFYFNRSVGIIAITKSGVETPIIMFDGMKYLYSDKHFDEIEFLGHVFGFPKTNFTKSQFEDYITKSLDAKQKFFNGFISLENLTDIDLTLRILND